MGIIPVWELIIPKKGGGMGQQASLKASAAQRPTTPPSRGPPVGNRVRGGRPNPRRDKRAPRGKEPKGRMSEHDNAARWCLDKNTVEESNGKPPLTIFPS